MPKVTVLMPVYNGEKYLHKAINSILSQTFQDFEFLIVNDGSTDNSLEIIISYQDDRIRVINNVNNLGISQSLNKGLNLAQGEYIARMDCDDISLPNRLCTQVDFLNCNPEIIVVGSYMELIDSEGYKTEQQYLYPLTNENIIYSMLYSNPLGHPSVMFRRKEVIKIGGYRLKKEWNNLSTEDYDLWLRLAIHNYALANIPECLIYYRDHPDSLTRLAFAHSNFSEGFNNCFYMSGSHIFGCSVSELTLLRERRYFLSISLFLKIAKHLSKNQNKKTITVLKSSSFISSMRSLTSSKDIISRLIIALLSDKALKTFIQEIHLIISQTVTITIKNIFKKSDI